MDRGSEFLSSIIAFSKYAQFLPNENRRETKTETINRNADMHIRKFPQLAGEINRVYEGVHRNEYLPSMRSMQFGGQAIEKHNAKIFNCCGFPIEDSKAFSEIMYLLLCGCGVGYSVKRLHTSKLPAIKQPKDSTHFLIADDIEGWADAVDALVRAYFYGESRPEFDASNVRKAGSRLSSGVIAPGPERLLVTLSKVREIFESVEVGKQLKPIDVNDIACHIADCVVSGGVRRSAMIVMFDWDDVDMLTCKTGDWWESNPQRGRANNSAVINKTLPEEEQRRQWDFVIEYTRSALISGSGDPAIYFVDNDDYVTNPCGEAYLYYNMCCLVEVNAATIQTQRDLNNRVKSAAFIATLQASYTDFKYLRPIWQIMTEKEGLIGVGFTGIVEGNLLNLNLQESAKIVKEENERVAKLIGINPGYRTTLVKPSGTATLFAGAKASGVHNVFAPTYIRRMRVGKNEAIYHWLKANVPALVEDEAFNPLTTAVLGVPIRISADQKYLKDETPIQFLERVKFIYDNWVLPGMRTGAMPNNVSATCYVAPEDHDEVFNWLWDNKESYWGMSLLPRDNANYPQMPLEACSPSVCEALEAHLVSFDPREVYEPEDMTTMIAEGACVGGACELKVI